MCDSWIFFLQLQDMNMQLNKKDQHINSNKSSHVYLGRIFMVAVQAMLVHINFNIPEKIQLLLILLPPIIPEIIFWHNAPTCTYIKDNMTQALLYTVMLATLMMGCMPGRQEGHTICTHFSGGYRGCYGFSCNLL